MSCRRSGVEPEIAFADLSDDVTLAEEFLKYIFRALLEERADDMAFFDAHVDKGCVARLTSDLAHSSSWRRTGVGMVSSSTAPFAE
jgi:aspartyl/asparaginyl-tRNA synthetase